MATNYESTYLHRAFRAAERSKSVLLTEVLRSSQAEQFAGIPDTLLEAERQVETKLAAYRKLIEDEKSKATDVNSTKILLWQSYLFDFNQERDSITYLMETQYPDYYRLKYDLSVASTKEVQDYLQHQDSTALPEYFMGDSNLYRFLITPDDVQLFQQPVDSITHSLNRFHEVLEEYRRIAEQQKNEAWQRLHFQKLSQASHHLYQLLIPLTLGSLEGINQLLIVPDGQLGYLPFELLLTQVPTQTRLDDLSYADLPYLLKSYQVRYEYSSTLLLEEYSTPKAKEFYAGFAPVYGEKPQQQMTPQMNLSIAQRHFRRAGNHDYLHFNQAEVDSSARLFRGRGFLGLKATKEIFIKEAANHHTYTPFVFALLKGFHLLD